MAGNDPDYARCIELLKTARKERGITQTALAGRLGKPQSFVSKFENSERYLTVSEFVKVARAIGLPLTEAMQAMGWE